MKINNKKVHYKNKKYYYIIKNKKYDITNLVNNIKQKYKTTNVNFVHADFDSKLEKAHKKSSGGS